MALTSSNRSGAQRVDAARGLFSLLADTLDVNLNVRLWDGSHVPLGRVVTSPYEISIASAEVLSSLVRRPTRDNLFLHYASGSVAIEGGDPLGFIAAGQSARGFKKLRKLPKLKALQAAYRVARVRPKHAKRGFAFGGDESDQNFIRFHYDLGNDFFALFLGHEMQYSCGYFESTSDDLDQAQEAKLERICRRLDLKSGERFLDVGCGWGGLLCHAASKYGVEAHGLTLSREQFEFTEEKIRRLGLGGQVSVEFGDYAGVEGVFDKIASVEMIEHIGLTNYPSYFRKMRSLLRDGGLLLNQATTRRGKRTQKRSQKLRVGSRLMERYVFPGFELDNVGHTLMAMEALRFEILETRGWRPHYAQTTRHWCRRLWDRRDEAEAMIGAEKTRLWLAYLAGVTVAFEAGSLRVYQIVAAKQPSFSRITGPSFSAETTTA